MSTTVTVRELRHDLKSVEQALAKGPVKVTKRGKVIWTIRAEKPSAKTKWSPPDPERARRIVGDRLEGLDVRDFIR
jgi:antitoxin (DNA-binding transcriptional repressor) of toxin-antitoxin stability system